MANALRLRRLTGVGDGECGEGDCPNVYLTNRRSFVVQGNQFHGFRVPEGEGLVEIPEEVLREAFRALGW
ncbi:hypothetical protein [Streptomyces sp. NPDC127098]|uniref:hypothetical protein n=1 Tax=Streptomyces sp. NPDC127098 TaxID=3347137 RepID=UPI00366A5432